MKLVSTVVNKHLVHIARSPVKLLAVCVTVLALVGCSASETSRSTGEYVDDVSLASRIKTSLLADGTTDGLDIEVEAFRGRVQLIGFVDSQAEIDRAGEIASNTDGVVEVANDLELVDDSRRVGEFVDDSVLVARINAELASDPVASVMEVQVNANRGVVSLGGFVNSEQELEAAVRVANEVDGVERVINNLAVR